MLIHWPFKQYIAVLSFLMSAEMWFIASLVGKQMECLNPTCQDATIRTHYSTGTIKSLIIAHWLGLWSRYSFTVLQFDIMAFVYFLLVWLLYCIWLINTHVYYKTRKVDKYHIAISCYHALANCTGHACGFHRIISHEIKNCLFWEH
jgi:hypothetical protein